MRAVLGGLHMLCVVEGSRSVVDVFGGGGV